jgi:acetyl-CoA C-acetyltransferase
MNRTDNKVVIVDMVRTPWGIPGGSMDALGSHDLAAAVLSDLLKRTGIDMSALEHVVFGQARPSTFPSNVARFASLAAGLPESLPCYTVQSNCASALQAVRSAYCLIASGAHATCIAGGAESYSSAPFVMRDVRFHFWEKVRIIYDTIEEGELWTQPEPMTRNQRLERLAERLGISTQRQQQWAKRSMEFARASKRL